MDVRAGARCRGKLPYPNSYRPWAGPNSNTFSRDGPACPRPGDPAPVECGRQEFPAERPRRCPGTERVWISGMPYGLIGILFAADEGLELNLLGLSLGVDTGQTGTVANGPR